MEKFSNQKGLSAMVVLIAVVAVVSIGATGWILLLPSPSESGLPTSFLDKLLQKKPSTGFADISLDEEPEELSSSDKTADIEAELTSTTLGDFDDDLSELDDLINEL